MGIRDRIISNWMRPQNNEFLQKVKGLHIFAINDKLHHTTAPFGIFSKDGKKLHIIDHKIFVFDRTYTPNRGVYQSTLRPQDIYFNIIFCDNKVFFYLSNNNINFDVNYGSQILLTAPLTL